jgi:putative membrane protein
VPQGLGEILSLDRGASCEPLLCAYSRVAISDTFEIQSSQLALNKQADRDTKPFAQKMVKDHQKTSKELKALIDKGKVKASLPSALDGEHQKLLDELKSKDGWDFDVAYDQSQLKAHREAVALCDSYAKSGDNPDLRKWAAKTLPHLKQHLEMARTEITERNATGAGVQDGWLNCWPFHDQLGRRK